MFAALLLSSIPTFSQDSNGFRIETSPPGLLDHLPSRIDHYYRKQLIRNGRFAERHAPDAGHAESYFCGIWGWNTWCGIHDLTPLVGPDLHAVMRATIEEGLSRPEPGTGFLPHALVLKPDGSVDPDVEYGTYHRSHGEDRNFDNSLCWAKMALEYALWTRETEWIGKWLPAIGNSVDWILANARAKFNPALVEGGIEADWTECTEWTADNADINVNLIETLRLLTDVESLVRRGEAAARHRRVRDEIREAFNRPLAEGGFWDPSRGVYAHGNDGAGKTVWGSDYFESTVNYFAILWGIASPEQARSILAFADDHPELELPYPVLTNLGPRAGARRKNYGRDVTNGDIWPVLGAHAAAARLRARRRDQGTAMIRAILDLEKKEGTIHNNLFPDGSANKAWSPELGNCGALVTPLVEGVLGLRPTAEGLEIHPRMPRGISVLRLDPLRYAGKRLRLVVYGAEECPLGSDPSRATALRAGPFGPFLLLRPSSFRDGETIEIYAPLD